MALGFLKPLRDGVRSYVAIDTRVLGAFRVIMGLFLMVELVDRMHGRNFRTFYTDEGIVPIEGWRTLHKLGPTLFAFTPSPASAALLTAAIVVVYVMYTVGLASRLAQVLVAVAYVSLDCRNPLAESGGTSVVHSLLLWTLFLPLGERFSVDAIRRTRPARETVSSVATFGLYVNLAIIYFCSGIDKTGPAWKDGTALHYAIWANEYCTTLGDYVRLHEPAAFSPLLSPATLGLELSLPILILSPIRWDLTRAFALPLIVSFHVGIALLMNVGCFTFAMPLFGFLISGPLVANLLFSREIRWLEKQKARLPRLHRLSRPSPTSSPPDAAPRWARFVEYGENLLASVALVAVVAAASNQNKPIPEDYRLTEIGRMTKWVPETFAINEGWGLFSPEPRRREEVFVIDAVLADGSHIDPLTNKEPDIHAVMEGPAFDDVAWRHWRRALVHQGKTLQPWVKPWIIGYADREHLSSDKRVVSFRAYATFADQPRPMRKNRTHFRTETYFSWPLHEDEPSSPDGESSTPVAPPDQHEPTDTSY